MRLDVDWITQESAPLDAAEQASYARCVGALARAGWPADAWRRLDSMARVCWADEVPRLAYAPQLRTAAGNLHYYSFLSRDPDLDRVNALFGQWLIARNAEAMRDPRWWAPVQGDAVRARAHGPVSRHGERVAS